MMTFFAVPAKAGKPLFLKCRRLVFAGSLMAMAVASLFATSTAAYAADVQEITTQSGIKAWLVEDRSLPVFAVKIAFTGAGSAYDPEGREGRATMAAALLTEGAGALDSRAFSTEVESHALGLQVGAEEDHLFVSLESLSEHQDKAFELLGLALTSPRFDSDSMERVKNQMLSIIKQQESRPGYQLQLAMASTIFAGHPYSRTPLGSASSLSRLARSDLKHYHERYLTRGNIVVAITGDLSAANAKRLLEQHLGTLPEHYDPEMTIAEAEFPAKAQQVHVDFDVPQTMVGFALPGLKRTDPDYMTAHVMNHILGGGGSLNARLGREIREKRGLAYSVYSGLEPMAHGALLRGGFATKSEQVGEAIRTLNDTLAAFAKDGPSDSELADAKDFLKGSYVLSLDSNAEIAAFLLNMQLHQLGADYLSRRNALVDAVTAPQVAAMAQRLIVPGRLQLVTVGKKP